MRADLSVKLINSFKKTLYETLPGSQQSPFEVWRVCKLQFSSDNSVVSTSYAQEFPSNQLLVTNDVWDTKQKIKNLQTL